MTFCQFSKALKRLFHRATHSLRATHPTIAPFELILNSAFGIYACLSDMATISSCHAYFKDIYMAVVYLILKIAGHRLLAFI